MVVDGISLFCTRTQTNLWSGRCTCQKISLQLENLQLRNQHILIFNTETARMTIIKEIGNVTDTLNCYTFMALQVGFFFPKLNYNWSKLKPQSVLYVLIQLWLMLNSLRGGYNFKLLPGHTWASCKRCDWLSLAYLAPNIIWRCFFP